MNVITTTDILFERKVVPAETKLSISEEQARSLIDQGVARKATKTVKVADEEVTPTVKSPKPVPTDKPLSKMDRTELEDVAISLGMDELEQIDAKSALLKAIENHQNPE